MDTQPLCHGVSEWKHFILFLTALLRYSSTVIKFSFKLYIHWFWLHSQSYQHFLPLTLWFSPEQTGHTPSVGTPLLFWIVASSHSGEGCYLKAHVGLTDFLVPSSSWWTAKFTGKDHSCLPWEYCCGIDRLSEQVFTTGRHGDSFELRQWGPSMLLNPNNIPTL